MKSFLTISKRLPLVLLASAALVSIGVGYGSYVIGSRVVGDMTRHSLGSFAHERARQIDNYLAATASDLLATANSPSVSLSLRNFENAWVQLGGNASTLLRQAIANDTSGAVDEGMLVEAGPALHTYKAQFSKDDPAFSGQASAHRYGDLYLLSPTGDILYSTAKGGDFATNVGGNSPGAAGGLARAFSSALTMAQGTASPAFVDFGTYLPVGDVAAFMAAPVFGFNGTLVGVIAIRIAPDVIASVAGDPIGLGDTGDILLIGDDGNLRIDAKPRKDAESLAGNINADVVVQALKGREAFGSYTTDGGSHALIAAGPLAVLGTNWAVAAVESEAEAFASIDTMRNTMLVVGGILLAITALIGLLFARTITGPITKLTGTMQKLAEGDLDIEVGVKDRGDEIGAMARTVEVFRANARRIAGLAEKEQAATEARRAERQAMMKTLQAAFGEVVDAAAVGDFSKRVDASQFSDTELRKIAASINSLVETVNRGLGESGAVLASLARADLSSRVDGHYEGAFKRLKDDINAVAEKISDVVGKLQYTSRDLKGATRDLLVGSSDLSDRTNTQAATVEETSAAMEQLSSTVIQNAQRAREASAAASSVTSAADIGSQVMREATAAMEKITNSAGKISDIIGLIDDIAFQTNLLALNASVEAARAGNSGAGFAVVAVEVRRLAQSAAAASAQVADLIAQSGQEVKLGSSLVERAALELVSIQKAARSSDGLMNAIAEESKDQAASIEEVNLSVRQIQELTQRNAALVEMTNVSIERAEEQASKLDDLVAVFRTTSRRAAA
ncbi:MAG: methyl-accepting chemotaxis protein [Devosia sp.]|nr:methyl-accepting chemotaxis protein [Devosia sp.]